MNNQCMYCNSVQSNHAISNVIEIWKSFAHFTVYKLPTHSVQRKSHPHYVSYDKILHLLNCAHRLSTQNAVQSCNNQFPHRRLCKRVNTMFTLIGKTHAPWPSLESTNQYSTHTISTANQRRRHMSILTNQRSNSKASKMGGRCIWWLLKWTIIISIFVFLMHYYITHKSYVIDEAKLAEIIKKHSGKEVNSA